MSRKESAAHHARTRKDLAESLGYDVGRLTAVQELKLDNAVALKLVSDGLRAALLRGEEIDSAELLKVTEGLQKLLPREAEPEPATPAIYRRDPYQVLLDEIAERWRVAEAANQADQAAERARLGLPEDPKDFEIAALRAEVERLRALPGAERVITPPTGDIVPPGEQPNRPEAQRYWNGGQDNPKPPVTIEGKVEGSWRGPQDGPPPWLRKSEPVTKRVNGGPPQTVSGDEAKRRMAAVNADRATPHRIMSQGGSEKFPQPESGGHFWGGPTGKRAW